MEKKRSTDLDAGDLHCWMNEFHDKFLSPQLDVVTADPGKFLAWLVLLSSLITFILGHIVYLAFFLLLYISWAYNNHINFSQDKSEEDVEDNSEENEWLLDKFFCFLNQLDNETFDLDLTAVQSDILDKASESGELAEFETEESKTTCSVVNDETDSLALDHEDEALADDEYEEDDSDCDDDFEFITKDDL